MSAGVATRDEARHEMHRYMVRTGLGLRELAERTGYAYRSILQFSSDGEYGPGEGRFTAEVILKWLRENPAAVPELPGRLYETEATREMDGLLAAVRRGRWGILYGPAGAQKTFLLEYRAAESASQAEAPIAYIRASAAGMTPTVLLRKIAARIGGEYAKYCDGMRESVLYALSRRRTPVALVLDEAQHLYRAVDTLETLREIGDLGRDRIGILVAGNEQVMQIFSPRRSVHFEQWRSRAQQKEVRVLGPSREEARRMLRGELGDLKEETAKLIIDPCTVPDPVSGSKYVSARRLFNSICYFREARDRKRVV